MHETYAEKPTARIFMCERDKTFIHLCRREGVHSSTGLTPFIIETREAETLFQLQVCKCYPHEGARQGLTESRMEKLCIHNRRQVINNAGCEWKRDGTMIRCKIFMFIIQNRDIINVTYYYVCLCNIITIIISITIGEMKFIVYIHFFPV